MVNVKHALWLAALLALGTPPAEAGEGLDRRISYPMEQLEPRLDKAEDLLRRGDAHSAGATLDSARLQWDTLLRDFEGQYDPNHPEILAMTLRLAALEAAHAAASGATTAATAEPETAVPPSAGSPPQAMLYVMEQIHGYLGGAEAAVEALDLKGAKASMKSATEYWDAQQSWNAGEYDPAAPEVVALQTRYDRTKAAVAKLEGAAAEAAADLPAVLEALSSTSEELHEAYEKARWGFRDLSSLLSDFDSGRVQDTARLHTAMDDVRLKVERIYVVLPDAHAMAVEFRRQFPDEDALRRLVPQGWEAGREAARIERLPGEWLGDARRMVTEGMDAARENLDMYGIESLTGLSDEDVMTVEADRSESWVIDYSASVLEIIDAALPELPPETAALLPGVAEARAEFQQAADAMRTEIDAVGAAISKVRKQVVDARRARLARARFPTSSYTGGTWTQAEQAIRGAWKRAFGDKQLLKVSIHQPWQERKEARWVRGRWVVTHYRTLGANCLAKLPDGRHMVYRAGFRSVKTPSGWSELRHYSVGHVYEMLEENIGK